MPSPASHLVNSSPPSPSLPPPPPSPLRRPTIDHRRPQSTIPTPRRNKILYSPNRNSPPPPLVPVLSIRIALRVGTGRRVAYRATKREATTIGMKEEAVGSAGLDRGSLGLSLVRGFDYQLMMSGIQRAIEFSFSSLPLAFSFDSLFDVGWCGVGGIMCGAVRCITMMNVLVSFRYSSYFESSPFVFFRSQPFALSVNSITVLFLSFPLSCRGGATSECE